MIYIVFSINFISFFFLFSTFFFRAFCLFFFLWLIFLFRLFFLFHFFCNLFLWISFLIISLFHHFIDLLCSISINYSCYSFLSLLSVLNNSLSFNLFAYRIVVFWFNWLFYGYDLISIWPPRINISETSCVFRLLFFFCFCSTCSGLFFTAFAVFFLLGLSLVLLLSTSFLFWFLTRFSFVFLFLCLCIFITFLLSASFSIKFSVKSIKWCIIEVFVHHFVHVFHLSFHHSPFSSKDWIILDRIMPAF